MKSIVFVIPTKNEEKSLGSILDQISQETKNIGYKIQELLVVDDSNDSTREIAKKADGRILSGGGRGLGEAMYRGLKEAARLQADYIISIDSDGQTDLKDLSKVLVPLEENRADFVLTSRRLEKGSIKYKYPFLNFLGIHILVFFLKRGTGLPLTDSHGGLRAMIPQVAHELEMLGTHTYVQETIFDAHRKGFRIIEVPSTWFPRKGRSRVLHSIPTYILSTLPMILLNLGWHRSVFFPLLAFIFCSGFPIFLFFSPNLGTLFIILSFLGMVQIVVLDILLNIIQRKNREK